MTDMQFKSFLDLMMVSDPWPLDERQHSTMLDLADEESGKRGYLNWIVAYHEFRRTMPGPWK